MLGELSGCLYKEQQLIWCGYGTASPQYAKGAELCIKFLYGLYAKDNLAPGNKIGV